MRRATHTRAGRLLTLVSGALWLIICIVVPPLLASSDQAAPPARPLAHAPALVATRTPTPQPTIIGYRGHTLAAHETLADVARRGGSSTHLLAHYNRLTRPPQAGHPLIVPQLAGLPAELPSETLLVARGNQARPYVALTFDAGAGSTPVPAILAALRARQVRVTFFLTGHWVERNPDLTRQMVREGHELANHSLSHPDLTTLSDAEIRAELTATEQRVQATTGTSTRPYFRPPFGAYTPRVLDTVIAEGYLPIYWTLDSRDAVGAPKTPAFLFERITTTLTPAELHGAIILAHCGSPATAEALPAILDRFAALGLEVRPLSDVLAP